MNIILDLLLIGIILLCTWNGYRKGLILGISGILALIIAFYGANLVAETYSSEFTEMFEPFISGLVDKSVDKAEEENTVEMENQVYDVSYAALKDLGFLGSAAANLAAELEQEVSTIGQELKTAMIKKLSSTVSYVIALIVVFILIVIIFTVIANIINLAFMLPGLELINIIGGSMLGFIKGLIFAFAIAWALRFFGFALPSSTVDQTLILGWLMESNPLNAVFGF